MIKFGEVKTGTEEHFMHYAKQYARRSEDTEADTEGSPGLPAFFAGILVLVVLVFGVGSLINFAGSVVKDFHTVRAEAQRIQAAGTSP